MNYLNSHLNDIKTHTSDMVTLADNTESVLKRIELDISGIKTSLGGATNSYVSDIEYKLDTANSKLDDIKTINDDTFVELTGVANTTLSNIATNIADVKVNTDDMPALYHLFNEYLI
eukprot:gene4366-6653_t